MGIYSSCEESERMYKGEQLKEAIKSSWELVGGKQKGFLSLSDYLQLFHHTMPPSFDRNVALELFYELDSDKDGKLTYKDFHDTMMFD